MDTSLCDEIFSHAEVMRSWTQSFKIPAVHSTDLIDLSVATGNNPKVPIQHMPLINHPFAIHTVVVIVLILVLRVFRNLICYVHILVVIVLVVHCNGQLVGRSCKCSQYRSDDVLKIFETSKLSQSNTKVETIKQQL